MNAAGHRHLTPWLAGVCLVLVALWLALLFGTGHGVSWEPPGGARPLPMARHQVVAGAPLPLEHYAEVWQRPLFTTNRKPAPVAADNGGKSVSLDNLALTGVILAPGMHMALLTDRGDGHTVRVREGERLAHGNWVLKALKPRSAEFIDGGQVTRLRLKVAAGNGSGQAGAASTSTSTAPVPVPSDQTPHTHPRRQSDATRKRIQALKARIEQRRRQQAAHAGEH